VALPEKLVDAVAELARTVRLDEAEAVLVEWWASVDRSEVIACEPELRALVERNFLPKRRRRIFETLSAQLARPPVSQTASVSAEPATAPVPAVLPQVGEVAVAEPMADAEDPSSLAIGTSHELLAEVGELNRTANPRGAEELFRKWFPMRCRMASRIETRRAMRSRPINTTDRTVASTPSSGDPGRGRQLLPGSTW
jgi:hypothetical protein